MSQKTVVTLQGYDANNAEHENCSVDSDYPILGVLYGQDPPHFGIVEYTFPTISPTLVVEIEHNLGYVPATLVGVVVNLYAEVLGYDGKSISFLPLTAAGVGGSYEISSKTDSKYIYINYTQAPPGLDCILKGQTYQFKYYIFTRELKRKLT